MAFTAKAAAPLVSAAMELITSVLDPSSSGTVPDSPQYDWPLAETIFNPTCTIINIVGPSDSGKSTLALTAPDPIVYLHASIEKTDGIIQLARQKGKDVRPWFFGGFSNAASTEQRASDYMIFWREFINRYIDAWSFASSIVIDTETYAWLLDRNAHFGAIAPKDKIDPITGKKKRGRRDANWAEPNEQWMRMFECAKDQQRKHKRCNLILISHAAPKYENQQIVPGQYTRKGQGQVKFLSDVQVMCASHQDPMTRKTTYHAKITKAWFNTFALMQEVSSIDGLLSIAGIMAYITGKYDATTGAITEFGDMDRWM